MIDSSLWHLVILKPQGGSTGGAVLKIMQEVTEVVKFKFVIMDYILGATKDALITRMREQQHTPLHLNDLLKILDQVILFDWGDFFLFEETPSQWWGEEDILYPPLVAETDTTIRAVDDTYIYVYTPYQQIVDKLVKYANEDIESITTDKLEDLSFPE
ncbi:MAG: hypothetical protein ACSNEK_10345 [Parachlamydiaceae bacterium]